MRINAYIFFHHKTHYDMLLHEFFHKLHPTNRNSGKCLSQIFAKYATQILAKYVTGATKKRVPFPIPLLNTR